MSQLGNTYRLAQCYLNEWLEHRNDLAQIYVYATNDAQMILKQADEH